MASIEESILQNLETAWGTKTPISWETRNQPFDPNQTFTGYDDNNTYIIPEVDVITRVALEVPAVSSTLRGEYLLTVNVVPQTDAGATVVETLFSFLNSTYTNQTITTGGYRMYFQPPLRKTFQKEKDGTRKFFPWECIFTVYE